MEVARLVLEYVRVLVWPLVVIAAVLMFRPQILLIFNRIKSAGLPGGVSIDFREGVREAETLSREVAAGDARRESGRSSVPGIPITEVNARLLSLELQPSPSGLQLSRYTDMAQHDPNVALAGLRMEIEVVARNLARGSKLDSPHNEPTSVVFRKLRDAQVITPDQHRLAQQILRLCNAAVHGTLVSREEAESVIDTAKVLADDFVAWLSWGFEDGWQPRGPQAAEQPEPS